MEVSDKVDLIYSKINKLEVDGRYARQIKEVCYTLSEHGEDISYEQVVFLCRTIQHDQYWSL